MTSTPKKIFIVDDEALIAFEMADTLSDLGFEVVGPSMHLDDALAVAKEADFDVACLDVNLGRGKTSEPIAKVLGERGIPYVYITAYEASEIKFAQTTDTVIRKPVSIQQLEQALLQAAA